MVYVKWVFLVTFWVLFASVLHYTLPQHDVVRVVSTDVRRVDFGANSIFWAQQDTAQETATTVNRDVRFVEAFYENGRPMVFRNEDTGWGWPPYFKLDSSNLQAELTDLVSTKADPQWVVLRHYGWRNEFYSIYPNAISVKPVAGPEYSSINWFNIVFLIMLAALFWAIYVRVKPNDPYYNELKAQFLLENGNANEALKYYKRALELEPNKVLLNIGYARALNSVGEYKSSVNLLKNVYVKDPNNGRLLRELATAYSQIGETGWASLLTAERYALYGKFKDAMHHAKRALGTSLLGSIEWLKAEDLILDIKNMGK